ncbi:hypothetical protein Vse01_11350 [Micromonospora sediminimaris]|uniref:Uncharacterized protein n=1 Tax=Micromonospora sediminimaris TaxID=547162 RepID=A0A9W5UMC1_9ACTN|nr:hypothetical protein Vse01_11350 [Micromonospora sediminimaris]
MPGSGGAAATPTDVGSPGAGGAGSYRGAGSCCVVGNALRGGVDDGSMIWFGRASDGVGKRDGDGPAAGGGPGRGELPSVSSSR